MTTAKNGARKIKNLQVRITLGVILPADKDTWLVEQANQYKFTTALAHCDDGVNWGVFKGGVWHWSHKMFPAVSPEFRWETLQQLRCFGASAEVFVWRASDGFACRVIEDVDGGAGAVEGIADCFDEDVLLWGMPSSPQNDFVIMQEGQRGLRHAPPKDIAERGHVTFRHYLNDDKAGCARVVASRLVESNQGG